MHRLKRTFIDSVSLKLQLPGAQKPPAHLAQQKGKTTVDSKGSNLFIVPDDQKSSVCCLKAFLQEGIIIKAAPHNTVSPRCHTS